MPDPQAPQGVTLDLSKSVPLQQQQQAAAPQAAPSQPSAPSAPAFTPPQGVTLDMSKSIPVGASNDTKPLPPFDPKVAGRYTTEANYPKWARTQPRVGPDTPAGEYEAWSGVQSGTNKDQAMDALKATGDAAMETAAGVTGAEGIATLATPGELAGMAKAATGELLPALTKGVKAVGEWAEAHPTMAKLVLEGIKESAVLGAGYKLLKHASK
jgi:hypothetical protein